MDTWMKEELAMRIAQIRADIEDLQLTCLSVHANGVADHALSMADMWLRDATSEPMTSDEHVEWAEKCLEPSAEGLRDDWDATKETLAVITPVFERRAALKEVREADDE